MDAKTRIMTILLIGKIKADPEYAGKIVTDSSHYRKDEEAEEYVIMRLRQ